MPSMSQLGVVRSPATSDSAQSSADASSERGEQSSEDEDGNEERGVDEERRDPELEAFMCRQRALWTEVDQVQLEEDSD